MPRRTAVGRLKQLQASLEPEVYDLAMFLCERFDELGMSVRAFAETRNRDPGTVSRFLKGVRIPPPDFVEALVANADSDAVAGTQRSLKLRDDQLRRGRDLRMRALQKRNARAAEVEDLRQKLVDIEREKLLVEERERVLSEGLLAKRAEYEDLMQRYRDLESERGRLEHGAFAIEQRKDKERELDQSRTKVETELDELRADLAKEKASRAVVERRRDELRAALEEANLRLARTGGDVVEVDLDDRRQRLLAYLSDRRARWSGLIGLVAVPSVIYAGPLYFGMIYGFLPGAQIVLRLATICGLAIAVWFAYGVRMSRSSNESRRIYRFIRTMTIMGILFFVGTFL
jgi:hypothetical protein